MHDHSHHSSHRPLPTRIFSGQGMIFLIATLLNILFVVIELCYGFWADSLALIADAGHNASDVIGLLLAWGAMALSQRKPFGRYTYGLQSLSIIAAMVNAVLLLGAVGVIAWEALGRIHQPGAPEAITMIIVAFIGTIINGITAILLHKGHQHDLNIRGAYLHMLADAAISLGVVLSALIILQTGWFWIDPVVSILISAIIMWGAFRLLRDSVNLALHAVPASIDINHVQSYFQQQKEVRDVYNLHIWAASTTHIVLSVHLLMPEGYPGDDVIHRMNRELKEQFGINQTTIQINTNRCTDNSSSANH